MVVLRASLLLGPVAVFGLLGTTTACGRIGFDADGDASAAVSGDGGGAADGLGPPPGWAVTLGGGSGSTWINDLVEDADGDVWIVGSSRDWGPDYTNPIVVELAGETGALLQGGSRNFSMKGEGALNGVLLQPTGLFVVGGRYDMVSSQQPAFGIVDPATSTYASSMALGGMIASVEEHEVFNALIRASDGSLLAVGASAVGSGGCAGCFGISALTVQLSSTGELLSMSTLGIDVGDTALYGAVGLPDGSFVVFGGGTGTHDYSGGAGTDHDSSPSIVYGLDGSNQPTWVRRLRLPNERGMRIEDGLFDAASGEVVLVGTTDYNRVCFVAHLDPSDGTIVRARALALDAPGEGCSITSVALAPDGGLFIAGYRENQSLTTRGSFVARLDPTRESAVWGLRTSGAFVPAPVRVLPSVRGDLVWTIAGTGSSGVDATIARVTADGSAPACLGAAPVTITTSPLADNSVAIGNPLASTFDNASLEPESPKEMPPQVAAPYARCP